MSNKVDPPTTWTINDYGFPEDVDSREPAVEPTGDIVMSFSDDPDVLKPGQFMTLRDAPATPKAQGASASAGYTYDYDAATWGACGVSTDDLKVVRKFPRANITSAWEGRDGYLNCGRYDGSGFGFNHILKDHVNDWTYKASYVGSSQWRHAADFAMYGAQRYPQYVRFNPGKRTYCLNRMVYVYKNGEKVNQFKGMVALGETGRRIITSYPARSWCGKTNTRVIYDNRP